MFTTRTIVTLSLTLLYVGLSRKSALAQSRVLPVLLGSSVTLDCTIPREAGSFLVWEKTVGRKIIAINDKLQGQFINSSIFSIHARDRNLTSLELTSLGLEEDGEYRCYDVNDLLTTNTFDVSILVRPPSVGVSQVTGQIDEGTVQTITCDADGGKPSPTIEWYITGPNITRTKLTGQENTREYTNGTWYKKSTLTFTVAREMYRSSIYCLVNTGPIPFYNDSFETKLDVNLAPLKPTMLFFSGLFNDGETKTISCESAGSRPAATVEWYLDGAKLENTKHEVIPKPDGTFFVSGIISLVFDKTMDGHPLRCSATNSVVKNNGVGEVNRSVTLLVTYPPRITTENGTREVTEGSNVVLTCLVNARPMPTPGNVFWRRNGNILNTGTGSRFNFSANRVADLHISSVNREDIGDYTCQAINTVGIGTGQDVHLNVLYRPVCTSNDVVKHAVAFGRSVTVTCLVEGNPGNATIVWRYKRTGNTIGSQAGSVTTYGMYGRPRETASTAVIRVTSDWQYTDIECVGTNALGVSSSPCLFTIVRPGPPDIPTNCTSSTLSDSEIQVQCTPGFDGGSDQYFVLQKSEQDGQYVTVLNSTSPVLIASDLTPETTYSFKFCAVSDLYADVPSCSSIISAQTQEGKADQQALASAGSSRTTGYIAGGILGGLVLVIVVVIIIFLVRKRRQNREQDPTPRNQNNLPDLDNTNHGGRSFIKEKVRVNEDSVPKNTNNSGNVQGSKPVSNKNNNLQFRADDNRDSFMMIIDTDEKQKSEVQGYKVQTPSSEVNTKVSQSNVPRTHAVNFDDICVKDFQNWLNGSTNFGKSSRHDLCYSEADISMVTMKPTLSLNDKSVSLDNVPYYHESKDLTNNINFPTGKMLANNKLDTFGTEVLSDAKPENVRIKDDEGNLDKNSFNRSSYKMAMENNVESSLHSFYSASVEALAALDATFADENLSDQESSSSDSEEEESEKKDQNDTDSNDSIQNHTDIVMGDTSDQTINEGDEHPYATIAKPADTSLCHPGIINNVPKRAKEYTERDLSSVSEISSLDGDSDEFKSSNDSDDNESKKPKTETSNNDSKYEPIRSSLEDVNKSQENSSPIYF